MLKAATKTDFEPICRFCKGSVYGTYIICRAMAYGFERSFAPVYLCKSDSGELTGVVSVLENNAVVAAGEECNFEELSFFLASSAFSSVLTDEQTAEKCGFESYESKAVLRFDCGNSNGKADSFADLKEVYNLFASCFPKAFAVDKNSYLSWLSDFTFRKNRRLSRLKAVHCGKTVCAAAVTGAECDDSAVISCVACRPEFRGKGYGRAVTLSLADELKAEGKTVFLISLDERTTSFYLKLGFTHCGKAAYIERS